MRKREENKIKKERMETGKKAMEGEGKTELQYSKPRKAARCSQRVVNKAV